MENACPVSVCSSCGHSMDEFSRDDESNFCPCCGCVILNVSLLQSKSTASWDPMNPLAKPWRKPPPNIKLPSLRAKFLNKTPWVPAMKQPVKKKSKKNATAKLPQEAMKLETEDTHEETAAPEYSAAAASEETVQNDIAPDKGLSAEPAQPENENVAEEYMSFPLAIFEATWFDISKLDCDCEPPTIHIMLVQRKVGVKVDCWLRVGVLFERENELDGENIDGIVDAWGNALQWNTMHILDNITNTVAQHIKPPGREWVDLTAIDPTEFYMTTYLQSILIALAGRVQLISFPQRSATSTAVVESQSSLSFQASSSGEFPSAWITSEDSSSPTPLVDQNVIIHCVRFAGKSSGTSMVSHPRARMRRHLESAYDLELQASSTLHGSSGSSLLQLTAPGEHLVAVWRSPLENSLEFPSFERENEEERLQHALDRIFGRKVVKEALQVVFDKTIAQNVCRVSTNSKKGVRILTMVRMSIHYQGKQVHSELCSSRSNPCVTHIRFALFPFSNVYNIAPKLVAFEAQTLSRLLKRESDEANQSDDVSWSVDELLDLGPQGADLLLRSVSSLLHFQYTKFGVRIFVHGTSVECRDDYGNPDGEAITELPWEKLPKLASQKDFLGAAVKIQAASRRCCAVRLVRQRRQQRKEEEKKYLARLEQESRLIEQEARLMGEEDEQSRLAMLFEAMLRQQLEEEENENRRREAEQRARELRQQQEETAVQNEIQKNASMAIDRDQTKLVSAGSRTIVLTVAIKGTKLRVEAVFEQAVDESVGVAVDNDQRLQNSIGLTITMLELESMKLSAKITLEETELIRAVDALKPKYVLEDSKYYEIIRDNISRMGISLHDAVEKDSGSVEDELKILQLRRVCLFMDSELQRSVIKLLLRRVDIFLSRERGFFAAKYKPITIR